MEENTYIPLVECKDRMLYRLSSRNLSLGVYCAENNGFIGLRSKFGSQFLFTEYHWDTGAPYGTACPLEQLEALPAEIALSETLGSKCGACQRPLLRRGSAENASLHYVHEDGTDMCPIARIITLDNAALFDYLAAHFGLPKPPA